MRKRLGTFLIPLGKRISAQRPRTGLRHLRTNVCVCVHVRARRAVSRDYMPPDCKAQLTHATLQADKELTDYVVTRWCPHRARKEGTLDEGVRE